MTKKILTILIFSTVLLGTLSPVVAFGQTTKAECQAAGRVWVDNGMGGECGASQQSQGGKDFANAQKENEAFANAIFGGLVKGIGYSLMSISGLILTIVGGTIFDPVMQFTVVDMAKNIGDATGVGGSITGAWTTLRDIANMCFIFVLLFAAFKSMFELNFGSVGITIRNIIIAALLINFSLFFTKVVIDASNIVSTGFYKSIVTANVTTPPVGPVQPQEKTISKGYMNLLGLTSWHDTKLFEIPNLDDPVKILGIGVLSSIFFLVAAVVLLVTAVMFLSRFIILIFLMILSPLAFIAYVAPGGKSKAEEWWSALKNQAVFAPVFFALTWVSFKMANGIKASFATSGNLANASFIELMGSNPTSYAAVVLNFILIIAFMIAALVISKKIASSTDGFSAISGGIFSAGAFAGRQTIGRGANLLLNSKTIRDAASGTGVGALAARAGLWTANKGSKGSFDPRGIAETKLSKALGGGDLLKGLGSTSGKGGITKSIEEKEKAKAKYAKEVYGTTVADKQFDDDAKKKLEEEVRKAKEENEEQIRARRKVNTEDARKTYEQKLKDVKDYEKEKLKDNFANLEELKKDKKVKEKELQNARKNGADELTLESLRRDSQSLSDSITTETNNIKEARDDMKENDEEYKKKVGVAEEAESDLKEAKTAQKAKIKDEEYDSDVRAKIEAHKKFENSGNRRQKDYAKRVGSGIFGWTAENQAAKRAIEKQATEKSKQEKFTDAAKELAKENEETPPTTPTTPNTPGGAASGAPGGTQAP